MLSFPTFAKIVLALLGFLSASKSLTDCDEAVTKSIFTGECNNKWKNLKPIVKPTQTEVGYAWIKYKLDKDFQSESSASGAIDAIPAIIGPGGFIYIVDDHHTLCALDYSGFEDISVTVNILCDRRNLTEESFWKQMSEQNLAYLAAHPKNKPNSLPVPIDYTSIPTSFSFTSKDKAFRDDPWRSLAGYSRKVENAPSPAPSCDTDIGESKYCERCMFRGCEDGFAEQGKGVPYFEFRWSYFVNDASYYQTSYWPSSSELKDFLQIYEKLYEESDIDAIDSDDWMKAAESVIVLCRASETGKYYLPKDIYPTSTTLPGYIKGYDKLEDDPSCDLPVCQ